MSLPGMKSVMRSAMANADVVHIEWTYTDGSGAVLFDGDNSDKDTLFRKGITTPVADGGTGLTTIAFPPCTKVRVLHCELEPPVNGTSEKQVRFGDIDPVAGTGVFVICTAPSTLADPAINSRGRLTLAIDYA